MATRLSRRRLLGTAAVFAVLGPLIAACGQAAAPAATVAPAKPAEPTRPTAAEPTSAPAATKPAEAAKPAAPAAAAPAKAVGGKGVKIQYMHVFAPEGPAGETLKRLFERFNSSQGDVVAESVFVAGGQLGEKTNALLAAGTPPDILWGGFTVKWADEGLIVPVEDLFSLTNFDVKRFPGTFPDLLRYKRKLWVLPYELSAVTVGYNADLFKEKGVPEPKFGWTWEQMTEAALKLTDPAKNIWGWNNTRPAWQWFDAIKGGGGDLWDTSKAPARSGLDLPGTVYGIQKYGELWTKLKVTSVDAPVDEFNRTGRYAMWPSCVAIPGYGPTLNFKYNATSYPVIKNKACLWCWKAWTFFKTTAERQNAAWKLADWFYQEDNFVEWATGAGYLPVTTAGLDHPRWKAAMAKDPAWEAPVWSINNGYLFTFPLVPQVDGWYTPYQDAIDSIALGKASAEEAMNKAAKAINNLIDQGKCIGC